MSAPHVIGLQMDLAWEYGAVNRARAEVLLEERQPPRGALVVLPEMFTTGFSMNVAAAAEPAGGPTESWLTAIARRWGIFLLAGLARRDSNARCGNDALVINPEGKCIATYRKQRPFAPGGEDQHYTAGNECVVFNWNGVHVATFICYDLRFPEIFRVAALRRPELFAVIANWPEARIEHWVKLLQARAIENQAYVIGVNRIGSDPTHRYPGRSLIVNPSGEIVADAGELEGFIEADIDLESLGNYRKKLPFLNDLRPLTPVT